jgi:hypothetical protein
MTERPPTRTRVMAPSLLSIEMWMRLGRNIANP